ncbi:MAG: hypothetical protein AABX47_05820 [Nanoarchaeota archaeon]
MGYGETYGDSKSEMPKTTDIIETRCTPITITAQEAPNRPLLISAEQSLDEMIFQQLIQERGYHREIDGEGYEVELETKLDLYPIGLRSGIELSVCEEVPLPEHYVRGRVLERSEARADIYGTRQPRATHAFTIVYYEGKTKIKEKSESTYHERGDVTLIERIERNIRNLKAEQVTEYIRNAKQDDPSVELIGTFTRKNKEAFVWNRQTGRIFVIEAHHCVMGPCEHHQMEIEYFGRLNRLPEPKLDVYDDMARLAYGIRKNLSQIDYEGKQSLMTKFEWVLANANIESLR